MRLLAATSPEARGRITGAGEVVGVISVEGTVALISVGGLFAGGLAVVPYLLRRWLPQGYLGGLAYGVLLLLLVGARLDPLRPDNIDFVVLGPDWLALLSFAALAIAFGVLLTALAARFGRSLPLLPTPLSPATSGSCSAIGSLLVVAAVPLAAVLLAVGVAAVHIGPRLPPGRAFSPSRGLLIAGRITLVVVAVVSVPSFVTAVDTILHAS